MKIFTIEQAKISRFIMTIFVAAIGGLLFKLLHIPVPWFLGPMAAVLIGSRSSCISLLWPVQMRNMGMVIVGYSMGISFTIDALRQIISQLPTIFLMTVILITCSSVIAFVISKLSGIDYPNILAGSIPGGLSQMVLLAEETDGLDLTIVTFLQVTRQIMIFFLVPLYIFNPFFGVKHQSLESHVFNSWQGNYPRIMVFAAVCLFCAVIGKKLKMPTSFLVGPIIGSALLNILGFHGPALPVFVLNISQFMIGSYIGLLLKPEKLTDKKKILFLSIISGFCLLLTSFGLSLILNHFYGVTYSTSYLSIAPGGMDQMGILAQEIHANLSMVVGFQLFRLFFIFFVVPPILKLVCKRFIKHSNSLVRF